MKFNRAIHCVDTHTSGAPTRIVMGGIPYIPGKDMKAKVSYFKASMDDVRTSLLCEPRGHFEMTGAVMTEPTDERADFGLIFMDNEGYLDICGHALIGAATAAIELGIVENTGHSTSFKIDTEAGQVTVFADVENDVARSITVESVPSFFVARTSIDVETLEQLSVEVSYGGNFFAIVDAESVGIELKRQNLDRLIRAGLEIRSKTNEKMQPKHPTIGLGRIDCVEFSSLPAHPDANLKNVVVFGPGQVDREPCVTGTCAKMAALYADRKLKVGDEFVHESILGTLARGKILKETRVGNLPAIIVMITETAYVTGIHDFVMSRDDPLRNGFILR